MPRIDLYRNVHMGQRARLFALAVDVGAADIAPPGAAAHLADRCLAMTRELREHADHEDTFIHQLLRERAPEAADVLDAEHVRLDAAFAGLDERARELPAADAEALPDAQHALYLALNEVISAYLAHLHAEETVAMPALWQYAAEQELAAVFAAFRASRTPEQGLADLRRMLPALPPAVRAAIVRGVLEAGPQDQAGTTLAALSTTLSPDQRARLHDDLGVPEAWAVTATSGV
ncbi:hemerythrin domain-containing protein [Streptomyces sp. TRM64462]|uniref:hemerythrin domain-containing protein n=1 Tax=Streptomyces sp. TRM64462 TaxID=2741726 RepID=UPI0015864D15|nr:hemerythrin domain-containing protein [Streptomyces sp. TRM64462]